MPSKWPCRYCSSAVRFSARPACARGHARCAAGTQGSPWTWPRCAPPQNSPWHFKTINRCIFFFPLDISRSSLCDPVLASPSSATQQEEHQTSPNFNPLVKRRDQRALFLLFILILRLIGVLKTLGSIFIWHEPA